MTRFLGLLFLYAGSSLLFGVEPLPLEISASDPNLRYVGRWDAAEASAPRCAWSASRVMIRFEGKSLNAKIKDNGKNLWQVLVDGQAAAVIQTQPGEQVYGLAGDLAPGEHTVELVKRTEASVGPSQFLGFQAGEGTVVKPVAALARRIEVVGDSISCGYGNESASEKEHFAPATENACLTYGAIAAKELGAEYVCVAWSGKKLWPNNTIPELYDRIIPQDAASKWDFSKWRPDAVVINLATNDFASGNPDEAGWVNAYKEFIGRIRKNYPEARIYCAIGTMMSDGYPKGNMALTTVRKYIGRVISEMKAEGEDKLGVVDFGTQKPENGIGGDWHPSVKTHQLMGEQLENVLKKDLAW